MHVHTFIDSIVKNLICMIIIFSSRMDVSTDKVMDWLNCFGKVVLRINSTDFQEFVKNVSISNESSTIHFFFRGLSFTEEDIEAVWFRRHA